MARAEIRAVEGALEQVLVHLLKHLSSPTSSPAPSSRAETLAFQAAAARSYRPSMRSRSDWDDIWTSARRVASSSLVAHGERLVGGLPDAMPFAPDDLVVRSFEVDHALERFADVLKRGADAH